MRDRVESVRAYYDRLESGEASRLQRHQLERDITVRYFEEYLPPNGRTLEIGAATGGYTVWLAEHGYRVTAVDLSEVQLRQCRNRMAELGFDERVQCYVADARDLSSVPGDEYDAVLLMGPLYHLIQRENRLQALGEAVGRLKAGGILMSAFISRFGILGHLLRHVPGWVEIKEEVQSVIAHGYNPLPVEGFQGYYVTVDEIRPLHEELGLETLQVAGVEPGISADDESYNALDGERRKLWLDLLYQVSREPSMVASSRHLLYVGRKR